MRPNVVLRHEVVGVHNGHSLVVTYSIQLRKTSSPAFRPFHPPNKHDVFCAVVVSTTGVKGRDSTICLPLNQDTEHSLLPL